MMAQDRVLAEVKQMKQRQIQLGIVLMVVCAGLFYSVRGGYSFATTWGVSMMVGLLVEMSGIRRTSRLLELLSGNQSK